MIFLSVDDVVVLLNEIGLDTFLTKVITSLKADFTRWEDFHKSARHATHYPHGVIELMPCADQQYYGFKYVNGHPENPAQDKLSVFAFGVLTDVKCGYPLLLTEMTLLTAVRTAATAALAATYLAKTDSSRIALIGCGAQSEFITLALKTQFPVKEVVYFDIDKLAMKKYARNLESSGLKLTAAKSVKAAVKSADIIVTATAAKLKSNLITTDMIAPGQCFLGLGGDCPGKTEFSIEVLDHCKIAVEFLPQSLIEGEIQDYSADKVHAELWQIIRGIKPGRESKEEITLFDSVGFALEDFSILKLIYEMLQNGEIKRGTSLAIVPDITDPKNLFGMLS